MVITVQTMLSQLDLQEKLITITGNNASNNKTTVSKLFHFLIKITSDKKRIQF